MNKHFRFFLSLSVVVALSLIVGCKKDDDTNPEPTTTPEVKIVVKPMIGDEPMQLNTSYDLNGQNVSFEFFKFYMSGLSVVDDSGTVLADNGGEPILVSTEQNSVTIGNTNADHFHELRFDIGLDSLTNHADPITATGVLNDSFMHWNWNPLSGYKFTRIDYRLDGIYYESHAAMDIMYRPGVVIETHDIDVSGDSKLIVLLVDVEALFASNPLPPQTSHGGTNFNGAYMNTLGSGSVFSVE